MLDFDVETARLAILCETGKVVTRDGKLVNIFGIDLGSPYPILGDVDDGHMERACWTIEGKYFSDGRESDYDLFIEELC